MGDDSLKRRIMFGVIGFNVTAMVFGFGFIFFGGGLGCLGYAVTLGLSSLAAGAGFVGAMMTE